MLLIEDAMSKLERWRSDPSAVQDDETDAPSTIAIDSAHAYLAGLRVWIESERPMNVAPLRGCSVDFAGAIRLDFRAESLIFSATDTKRWRLTFEGNKFVGRQALQP